MQKSIYLTKRKPGFTHDDFVKRWRTHGALAMSKIFFNNMKAYVQAEIINHSQSSEQAQDYDGIAYIIAQDFIPDQADLDALQEMVIDEYETFHDVILPDLLRVEQVVIKAGSIGGKTAFLWFLDGAAAEHVAENLGVSAADRVILNRRQVTPSGTDLSVRISYQAVVEVSSHSLAVLDSIGVENCGADLVTITEECVMWNRLDR